MSQDDPAYPIIPSDRKDDLHNLEWIDSPDLVLFMAGNQFMVMEELIQTFQKENPRIQKIFYETLPPGLELKQILAGGAVFRDQVIDVMPDIYTSVSEESMRRLASGKFIDQGAYQRYLHNRIVLMVPQGNSAGIESVLDLGRDEVRISQPNPEYEDIAHHILNMYRDAGGENLIHRIMDEKRLQGTTHLTTVHHRETPLRIREKSADVGPVWATEIRHARESGFPVGQVEPGEHLDQREHIHYYVCKLNDAPHRENAHLFLDFLLSRRAQDIYASYGFVPYNAFGGSAASEGAVSP